MGDEKDATSEEMQDEINDEVRRYELEVDRNKQEESVLCTKHPDKEPKKEK